MAFTTTSQTVNQVVKQLCEKYDVAPGFVRHGLRELDYSFPTTSGYAKFNRDQMSTLWSDFNEWITEMRRQCKR